MDFLLSLLPADAKQKALVYVLLGFSFMLTGSQCTTGCMLYRRGALLRKSQEKIKAAQTLLNKAEGRTEEALSMYDKLSKAFAEKMKLNQEEEKKVLKDKKALEEKIKKEKESAKKLDLQGVLDAFRDLGY